jgi:hypothetical protein
MDKCFFNSSYRMHFYFYGRNKIGTSSVSKNELKNRVLKIFSILNISINGLCHTPASKYSL